ncbi:hypothetical protein AcW1_008769 [Taiwanofungus camphoratus]|nr:hypothetical protein AcW1_008769 [Antrodia cinnamomea]
MSALHATTPALFSLETFTNTGSLMVATTVGMPTVIYSSHVDPLDIWSDSCTLLTIPGTCRSTRDFGFESAMATNVTCGFLPNGTAVGSPPTTSTSNITSEWTVQVVYDDYNIVFPIPIISDPNVILPVTHSSPSQNSTQLPGRNVMFVLTANVTESSGSRGSVVSFEPPDCGMYIVLVTSERNCRCTNTVSSVSISKWRQDFFKTVPLVTRNTKWLATIGRA